MIYCLIRGVHLTDPEQYAVESQIRHHGLKISESMITIEPQSAENPILTTEYILSVIDAHATETALLLLPGIQFYTGQLFDIATITAHAQSKGIFVICDLAHAVGNVPLYLHDWNVDAAAWCSYKYINAGPGAIGGLFIHERNSRVPSDAATGNYQNRLSGWWGNDKSSRFQMVNRFVPAEGAKGFQLSNPSVIDITSLCASLEVFGLTHMNALRAKSVELTAYLEKLLLGLQSEGGRFSIITPMDPSQRGAQLSIRLGDGLLDVVMRELEERSVVVDERQPDVIRVAPAPLYNTFTDVFDFFVAFRESLAIAEAANKSAGAGGA
jgi:kynureninase